MNNNEFNPVEQARARIVTALESLKNGVITAQECKNILAHEQKKIAAYKAKLAQATELVQTLRA